MEGGGVLGRTVGRRRFLAGSALVAGGAAASLALGPCDPALIRRLQQSKNAAPPHHRAWVWQFASDGALGSIAAALAGKRVGVVLKTHDGIEWMSTYDRAADAITGPERVRNVASYFEERGVPFHAWCVVKGIDPEREAAMAADVLAAGARSLVLDLEGSSGFWVGTADDANRYGAALRQANAFGRVDISIDARPWRINLVPMNEFVGFCDGIWPQLYWDTFNTPANIDAFNYLGYRVPPGGITPEYLLDVTAGLLAPYEREVIPVGQGAAGDPQTWPRFAHRAWQLQMPQVSIWRLGVTRAETVQYLADNPPGPEPQAPPPPPPPPPEPTATRTPRPPDTPRPADTNTPVPSNTPPPTNTPRPPTATPTASPSGTATAAASATATP